MSSRRAILWLLPLLSFACATRPDNPSFPLTVDDADAALKEMAEHPRPLVRPLVIVGGYLDFLGAGMVRGRFCRLTGEDRRIIAVPLFSCGDFADCRQQIIAAVDKAFPEDGAAQTAEVDVVGVSMGGIAARFAAAASNDPSHPRRLHIARLFTISSPHLGATLAEFPTFHKLALQMRHGSDFLTALNAPGPPAGYPLVAYVRLDDGWVGEANAAPAGRVAWWVPNRPFENSHVGAAVDPRILADIARRLRSETPYTHEPAAPLPAIGS